MNTKRECTLPDLSEFTEFKQWEDDAYNGKRVRFRFENDMEASVVQHCFSYGYLEGKWEIGIIYPDEKLKVVGYCSEEETIAYVRAIRDLNSKQIAEKTLGN